MSVPSLYYILCVYWWVSGEASVKKSIKTIVYSALAMLLGHFKSTVGYLCFDLTLLTDVITNITVFAGVYISGIFSSIFSGSTLV